ncbi:hypothetical protein PSD17_03760 [Pseudonocardia sp. D17]|nr:hypothetical protein PSD17_03760 [Pseudonocardia sp. D17]
MRESALVARRDDYGREVLVVHKPVTFTLDEAARAMHAIVDSHLGRLGARNRVGRSRVREVLRSIVLDGWPEDFQPDPARVQYWRAWLVREGVFGGGGAASGPAEPC